MNTDKSPERRVHLKVWFESLQSVGADIWMSAPTLVLAEVPTGADLGRTTACTGTLALHGCPTTPALE